MEKWPGRILIPEPLSFYSAPRMKPTYNLFISLASSQGSPPGRFFFPGVSEAQPEGSFFCEFVYNCKQKENYKNISYHDSETKIKDVILNCRCRPSAACPARPPTWLSTYSSAASCLRQYRCAWTFIVVNGVIRLRQYQFLFESRQEGRPYPSPHWQTAPTCACLT